MTRYAILIVSALWFLFGSIAFADSFVIRDVTIFDGQKILDANSVAVADS